MNTFQECQALAAQAQVSLRNDRDRINFPALGLQEASGKIGALLGRAFDTGRFSLTPEQGHELKNQFSDVLWYVTRLCAEAGIPLQDVATHSIAQLETRAKNLDPDRR